MKQTFIKTLLRGLDVLAYSLAIIFIVIIIVPNFKGCGNKTPLLTENIDTVNMRLSDTIYYDSTDVTATVYHAVVDQCNSQPLLTAGMYRITHTDSAYQHRYIAVSQDLRKLYPYGDTVIISKCPIKEYNGKWIVADCMNKRFRKYVDFLINPNMKGGKWDSVVISKYKVL